MPQPSSKYNPQTITSLSDFDTIDFATPASLEVFHELMEIAKEIEACRASL